VLPAVRFVRWTVLVSVLVAIAVSVVLAGRSPSSPQSLSALFGGGMQSTRWGPLGPSDRDMLIKVRQANLWEAPMAEQAAQRGSSPAVREIGRKIAAEHAQLDADLRAVTDKLGMPLPSQPSDQQKVWMAEISGASAQDFDKTFVNIVRSAHGEVMPLVEGVRSGTQNELVRQFGVEAGQFIGRHMDYLESTGLVDYELFPPSTAPAARQTAIGGYSVPVTLVLFVLSVMVSAALLRGVGRPRPGTVPRGNRDGWWSRVGGLLGPLRSPDPSARSRRPGEAENGRRADVEGRRRPTAERRRRADAEYTVTTAELIAVLNPPALTQPLRAAGVRAASAISPGPAEAGAAGGAATRRGRSGATTRMAGIPAQRPRPDPARTRTTDPVRPRTTDPARTRTIDPVRTRTIDPARTRTIDPVRTRTDPVERKPPKLRRASGRQPW
jgi:predicted outer membrane protein